MKVKKLSIQKMIGKVNRHIFCIKFISLSQRCIEYIEFAVYLYNEAKNVELFVVFVMSTCRIILAIYYALYVLFKLNQ